MLNTHTTQYRTECEELWLSYVSVSVEGNHKDSGIELRNSIAVASDWMESLHLAAERCKLCNDSMVFTNISRQHLHAYCTIVLYI